VAVGIVDQSGQVVVAKADTLALGEPVTKDLTPADPTSAADVPWEPHRREAAAAFKHSGGAFELTLPVLSQAEAAVFTTIVNAAIIEQVLASDGTLNTHATFLLTTSKGDRLPVSLPAGAKVFEVKINGSEAPVETGSSKDERLVRLPPSAGQVASVLLELSYGLDHASAGQLTAPTLPADLPVQQTLWRVCLPADEHVLWHSRRFSPASFDHRMLASLATDKGEPTFKLRQQGQIWDFVAQGPPGTLSVATMGKEWFAVLAWGAILLVGVAMVRTPVFWRVAAILVGAVVLLIVNLSAPLLVHRFVGVGWPAVLIVLLLWVAYILFIQLPKLRAARRQAAEASMPPLPPAEAGPATGEEA
jgi:hypothetical protein